MKIKGASVKNTLDLAVFGDILMWVATFLGFVPWDKVFSRKKDFQEQLAELNGESNACLFGDDVFMHGDRGHPLGCSDNGREIYPGEHHSEPTERVCVPWGVVPYKCRIGRRL